MTIAEQLAAFATRSSFDDLSEAARDQLRIRVLDSIACGVGAVGTPLISELRAHTEELGGAGKCTLIGGGRIAPDRAAFFNSALIRYLDFNDSYLARGETCHPSDNLGAVLAASEYAGRSGRDFLTALALAYQVQCRLSDVAPVRAKGFDHTTQGSFALASGIAKALGLDTHRTANAIAICGTAFHSLRVSRTGSLSNWKGLAYPNTAFGCMHAALLASRGITGPLAVFEGNKGFMDSIAGRFEIDWARENLEAVTRTAVKKYNAEIHSQSAIDAAIELKRRHRLSGHEIEQVEIEIFDVAFHIIGGGEEGDKGAVSTKEQADHSLPYLTAVALLDGQVLPEQFAEERIRREDAQSLLRKVRVRPSEDFSRRFPREMPCRVTLTLADGRIFSLEKRDYEGFTSRPASWEMALRKFEALGRQNIPSGIRARIAEAVARLEQIEARELAELLAQSRAAAAEPQEALDHAF